MSGLGHSARPAQDSATSPRPLWDSVSPAVGPPGSPALAGRSGEGSAEGAALVWRRRNSLALPGRGRPQRLPIPYPAPALALTPAQPHLAPPLPAPRPLRNPSLPSPSPSPSCSAVVWGWERRGQGRLSRRCLAWPGILPFCLVPEGKLRQLSSRAQ